MGSSLARSPHRSAARKLFQSDCRPNSYWICLRGMTLPDRSSKRRKISTEASGGLDQPTIRNHPLNLQPRPDLGSRSSIFTQDSNLYKTEQETTGPSTFEPRSSNARSASDDYQHRPRDTHSPRQPGYAEGDGRGITYEPMKQDSRRPALFPPLSELFANMKVPLTPKAALAKALREKDLAQLVRILRNGQEEVEFISRIPKTTWFEILRLLDSRKYLPNLHVNHRSSTKARIQEIRRKVAVTSEESYLKVFTDLINLRRELGVAMSVGDYRLLLVNAARVGNIELAKALWSDMIRDRLIPDPTCYRAYIQAIVYSEKSRLRLPRSKTRLAALGAPKTSDLILYKPGALQDVRQVWKDMLDNGVEPDTECYCALMIALARERDFDGVKDILLRAFHIDVDIITSGAPAPSKSIGADSPLRFDNKLLITLADVFGSVNQTSLGLRVIDHVSNAHGIKISQGVWYKMTQWTWYQARISTKDDPSHDLLILQQRLSEVTALSSVMQSSPYELNPSVDLRDLLIRANSMAPKKSKPLLFRNMLRGQLRDTLRHMEMGRRQYMLLIDAHRKTLLRLRRAESRGRFRTLSLLGSKHERNLRKLVSDMEIKKRRHQDVLFRWARMIIPKDGINRRFGVPTRSFDMWRVCGLINVLRFWYVFMPDVVKYRTATGTVELVLRTEEEKRIRVRRWGQSRPRTRFVWLDLEKASYSSLPGEKWKRRTVSRRQKDVDVEIESLLPEVYDEDEISDHDAEDDGGKWGSKNMAGHAM